MSHTIADLGIPNRLATLGVPGLILIRSRPKLQQLRTGPSTAPQWEGRPSVPKAQPCTGSEQAAALRLLHHEILIASGRPVTSASGHGGPTLRQCRAFLCPQYRELMPSRRSDKTGEQSLPGARAQV
jgi:hypothetical protein